VLISVLTACILGVSWAVWIGSRRGTAGPTLDRGLLVYGGPEVDCFNDAIAAYRDGGLEGVVTLMEYGALVPGRIGERFAARCLEMAHCTMCGCSNSLRACVRLRNRRRSYSRRTTCACFSQVGALMYGLHPDSTSTLQACDTTLRDLGPAAVRTCLYLVANVIAGFSENPASTAARLC
jgi:hypothetical protein